MYKITRFTSLSSKVRPIVAATSTLQRSVKTQPRFENDSSSSSGKKLTLVPGALLKNPRSEYRMVRKYQGKVKACIFDWAGTVVDCGVCAPALAFSKVFEQEGVPVTAEEARGPMGTHKKVHIKLVTEMESVRNRWFDKFGRYPNGEDIDRMYKNFVPTQLAVIGQYSEMITGAVETVDFLRDEFNLKIGSCTGFTSEMVEILKEKAAANGYVPDCYVAADEVPEARPHPYMVWLNAIRLNVNPIEAIVKVDDTADGVREGTSAGCWSVGLAKTGNYVALNEDEIANLSEEDYERKLTRSYEMLSNSGAHYVIDSITDLPPVIDDINRRLASGEKP